MLWLCWMILRIVQDNLRIARVSSKYIPSVIKAFINKYAYNIIAEMFQEVVEEQEKEFAEGQ